VCEILDCCPWFEFSDLEVSSYFISFLNIVIMLLNITLWNYCFGLYF